VKPHSPVYATVLYHRVRLSAPDDARRLLDEFLPELRKTQPVSAVNLFLAQRLALARDLSEFLRAAPRQPVAVVYDTEQPVEPGKQKLMLAEDSTQVLNEEMPIAMLAEAAESDTWPVHLRSEVAVSAFARAVVTGDVTTAAKIATALPELRAKLDPFIRNPNAYTAAFAILDAPGIKPSVRPGFSRDEPLGRIDNLRDNWWCTTSPNHPYSGEDKPASAPPALFISKSDRERAAAERTSIDKLGPAPNYFGSVVLAWARTHREDPTVPEALHRVVRATRYGCTDSGTTAISRAAFQLLHSRYPASEWAKKTPYHF
jgi:hypothetical protein